MLKRTWAVGLLVLMAGAGVTACGDDDGGGPNGNEFDVLVGDYTATQFEFVSVADPNTTFDVITDGGGAVELSIHANGNYTLTASLPGFPDQVDQGSVEVNGDQITLDAADPSSGTFTLSGSTLTISITSGAEFDFDGDDSDEPATVQIVFEKI